PHRRPPLPLTRRHNVRSYHYLYDGLERLVEADLGSLSADNSDIVQSTAFRTQWLLDILGNWSGGSAATGSVIATSGSQGGGPSFLHPTHQQVDSANQITHLYENGQLIASPTNARGGGRIAAQCFNDL